MDADGVSLESHFQAAFIVLCHVTGRSAQLPGRFYSLLSRDPQVPGWIGLSRHQAGQPSWWLLSPRLSAWLFSILAHFSYSLNIDHIYLSSHYLYQLDFSLLFWLMGTLILFPRNFFFFLNLFPYSDFALRWYGFFYIVSPFTAIRYFFWYLRIVAEKVVHPKYVL